MNHSNAAILILKKNRLTRVFYKKQQKKFFFYVKFELFHNLNGNYGKILYSKKNWRHINVPFRHCICKKNYYTNFYPIFLDGFRFSPMPSDFSRFPRFKFGYNREESAGIGGKWSLIQKYKYNFTNLVSQPFLKTFELILFAPP